MMTKKLNIFGGGPNGAMSKDLGVFLRLKPLFWQSVPGPSPAEGPVVPDPHLKSAPPRFRVWPTGCYIHPILYFKNVAPLRFLAPPFGFWPPLLLNPGNGPGRYPLTHPKFRKRCFWVSNNIPRSFKPKYWH